MLFIRPSRLEEYDQFCVFLLILKIELKKKRERRKRDYNKQDKHRRFNFPHAIEKNLPVTNNLLEDIDHIE